MKQLLLLILIFVISSPTVLAQRSSRSTKPRAASTSTRSSSSGAVRVRGYTRKDGTYVAPHYRSRPDGVFENNWSTKGNVNPYTGKPGTKVIPPTGDRGYQAITPVTRPRVSNLSTTEESTSTLSAEEGRLSMSSSGTEVTPPTVTESPCPETQPIQIVVVIKLRAYLRASPNNVGSVVREVSEGNALVLGGERVGGWYNVTDVVSGDTGWIHGNTIRIALTK